MLPNHAPLQVAERFKVLEGLFPIRIDLGLGRARAPTGDVLCTAPAAKRSGRRRFLDRFQELLAFEGRLFPEGHPFRKVNAMPGGRAAAAALSSRLVGLQRPACGPCRRRLLVRASFFRFRSGRADDDLSRAIQAVGDTGQAAGDPRAPCGLRRHDADAERLASSVDLNFALRRQGRYQPIPSPEEAAAHSYSPTIAR